jgi:hypothetical protein
MSSKTELISPPSQWELKFGNTSKLGLLPIDLAFAELD